MAARNSSATRGSRASTQSEPGDFVDGIAAAWAATRPEVDSAPVQVIGRILRGSKLILQLGDARLRPYGLVRADFDILATLRRLGRALSPTETAALVLMTAPAITKRLQKLETSGFISRTVNSQDRRGFLIELTDAGADLIDELFPQQLQVEAELLASLSHAEQVELAGLLRTLLLCWESPG
jgi:DNA-binding MarR family transcriptional regulator